MRDHREPDDAVETLAYVVTGLIILGLIITAILGAGAFQ